MDDEELIAPGLEALPGSTGMILRRAEQGISPFNDMALMKLDDDVTSMLDQYLDDIANKLLPLEESDLMVKSLERQADHKITRTYLYGEPLPWDIMNPSAPKLIVGLTFVPGADRAQVARIEIDDLVGEQPNQKSSIWRVNTAGTLLKNFEVDDDLYVNQKDRTSAIYTAAKEKAERAKDHHRRRIRKSDSKQLGKDVTIYSGGGKENMVNIDSDHVHLVKDLRVQEWDVQSTLIEVDGKSLVALMLKFRHLIKQTTAADASATSFAEMASILEKMIENARRLCMKSPILFRMSTRSLIKNSKDIRYGVNQDHMFQTLSTSRGIRETIRNSAAYWLALSGLTSNLKKDRKEQEKSLDFIRTRYLQMLVLLLSFLNNDDLNDLKEFLETTYNMKADRKHVEMLILKVIPLQSINPKVFMKQLIATVEDNIFLSETGSLSQTWDIFVQRILGEGYLLPGNTESLGRKENSWIVQWPKGKRNGEPLGFSSSDVFNNMQYSESSYPLLNQVPPFELHPEASYNELTVIMKNGRHYKIDAAELEKISAMVPGTYAVWEAQEGGRHCDLEILQYEVNSDLWRAISLANGLIHKVNVRLAAPRRRIKDIMTFRQPEVRFWEELKGCGKLTRHEAGIGQDSLAIVYKKEGRMITRKEAVRNMNEDLTKLEMLIRIADMEVSRLDAKRPYGMDDRNLIQELQELKAFVHSGKQGKIQTADTTGDLGDDPISKVIYPPNLGVGQHIIWFDYQASTNNKQPYLEVRARVDLVASTVWDGEDMFTVGLNGGLKLNVSPLVEVPEGYVREEIKAGDTVVLIGQYIAIASSAPPLYHNNQTINTFYLDNYLRIVGVEEQSEGGRRGRNREEEERPSTLILFR
jgi:hypothetical protein